MQIPEAANGGVLWKIVFLKMSKSSQENACARAYVEASANEAREIDCLCYEVVNAMLPASAKTRECEGSMSPSSFYGHLPDY